MSKTHLWRFRNVPKLPEEKPKSRPERSRGAFGTAWCHKKRFFFRFPSFGETNSGPSFLSLGGPLVPLGLHLALFSLILSIFKNDLPVLLSCFLVPKFMPEPIKTFLENLMLKCIQHFTPKCCRPILPTKMRYQRHSQKNL